MARTSNTHTHIYAYLICQYVSSLSIYLCSYVWLSEEGRVSLTRSSSNPHARSSHVIHSAPTLLIIAIGGLECCCHGNRTVSIRSLYINAYLASLKLLVFHTRHMKEILTNMPEYAAGRFSICHTSHNSSFVCRWNEVSGVNIPRKVRL